MTTPQPADNHDDECRKLRDRIERAALEKALACTAGEASNRDRIDDACGWLTVAYNARNGNNW